MTYNQFYLHPLKREDMVQHMLYELDRLRFYGKEPDEIVVNLVDWEEFRTKLLSSVADVWRPHFEFEPVNMWGLPVTPDTSISPGGFVYCRHGAVLY